MENKDLINGIIDLYKGARKIKAPTEVDYSKIRRGRSHVVYSLTEDLFSVFIAKRFPEIEKILVDQPISFRPSKKAKTIYPDISIIQQNEIHTIIDIKMDLGHKRSQVKSIFEKSKKLVQQLRNKKIWYKDGITKEEFKSSVSKNLKYFIVVVSKLNINQESLKLELEKLPSSDYIFTEYYFLTDKAHPNWTNSEAAKKYIEITSDMERFLNEINTRISKH